ncbi:MAG TPA: hypothetical protein V6D23_12705, partial [Candidatus Obscuribacterales bacterium]
MTSNPQSPVKKKPKKKKKADPFWPIVIILSILAFTGSFWFFYMLTSKINTRTFPTTDTPKLMLTPTPDVSLTGSTLTVGNNRGESPSPSPSHSVALISSAPASTAPSSVATEATSAPTQVPATPLPTRTPAAIPTRTPRPVATAAPTVAPTAVQKATYRVHVGSYGSRDEAQQVAG